MLKKLAAFIKYNNAFSIGFALVFLSTAGALAASPELRETVSESIVAAENQVTSVDNSYIVGVDLDAYAPKVQIVSITEDDEYYHVAYTLQTIDLAKGVWQDVIKEDVLKVSKIDLGGEDLGLYVTRQLGELVEYQHAYLREVQGREKEVGVSSKVVATAYSGLIGKFLDSTQEEFPGYTPVIPPPEEPVVPVVVQPVLEQGDAPLNTSGDSTPPVITIVGNNPAELMVGETYNDLGATVTDNVNTNLGIETTGAQIDTAVAGEYTVEYSATDQAGNTARALRTVIVSDPNAQVAATSTPSEVSTDTSTSTPVQPDESVETTTPQDTAPPTVVLIGEATVEIAIDGVYEESGATATDAVDGDLTGSIVVTGSVDSTAAGTYTITYSVEDAAGNGATASRQVTVVAPEEPSESSTTTPQT